MRLTPMLTKNSNLFFYSAVEKTNPNMVHEITVQHGDDEESQESVVVTAEALRSYAEEIQRFVESQDLPVVFCHNDLNSENIIRHEGSSFSFSLFFLFLFVFLFMD